MRNFCSTSRQTFPITSPNLVDTPPLSRNIAFLFEKLPDAEERLGDEHWTAVQQE
jgi:hypothetical protein